jgi:hypothetical protein
MLVLAALAAVASSPAAVSYSNWTHGPPSEPGFFPIAVWLQNPANGERYRKAGFNTYIGLWKGPTEEQLGALKKAGLRLICEQNEVALRHLDDPTIIGWMHGDEPDNAQALPKGAGWGPPIAPKKIEQEYEHLRTTDHSRPVVLNLGQGVAWDAWYGRGSRSSHPEDYPRYLAGCDIVSFDIYPAVHDHKDVAGKLWLVADGVQRLKEWSGGKKIVWNCVECTHISNPDRKPTPKAVRAEVWMSLIHGSQGLIYFVHEFKPRFREAGLLDDPEMLDAVTGLNHQITRLAPILNTPTLDGAATVESANGDVPVVVMVKQFEGATYLMAVAMRDGTTTAAFTLKGSSLRKLSIEVIDENRSLPMDGFTFRDHFESWDAHLYRITPEGQPVPAASK